MTPQTLMNDLKTENCDPRDIVLLVIGKILFREVDIATDLVPLIQTRPTRVQATTPTPKSSDT